MNKTSIGILVGIALTLIVAGAVYLLRARFNVPQPLSLSSPSPSALSSPIVSEQGNIKVTSPAPNQTVSLPIVIRGEARVFENQFNWRVRDADGTILAEGSAYANSPDIGQFGAFTISTNTLAEPSGTMGTIEVFDYSAKDASEIDKVTIPVQFDKEKNTTIRIYFGSNQQPGGLQCANVFPVLRSTGKTQTPARIAVEELLKGPTESEKLHGYFTSINTDVKIQKLTITDGVAQVDFDKKLEEQVGGSCRVAAIRAQITETLKQFPTVKNVIISIDGKTEDILQP
ncbi:MAG: GerMN domain-containing protein [Candidatus Curtissbacteria bacterium]|nr:GerMN domain-containing protein [Candidatus Curtissbacteria bacterium]